MLHVADPMTTLVQRPAVEAAAPAWSPARAISGGLRRLGYRQGEGRDLRFDFLRGFAVLAMVVDHIAGPSPLHALTGGNRFYTSAAEGFVFISGLVVGLVYHKMADRQGIGPAAQKLLGRAGELYLLAVGLTLVMLPVSEVFEMPWAEGVDLSDPATLLWRIVTLQQTYYLVDVPLLYALLLACSPIALLLMHQGRTWIVLAISWGLWAGYQAFPEGTEIPWPIAGNYLFQFPAWQVLLVTGMAIGYHRDRIARAIPRWSLWPLLAVTGLTFAGFVVLFQTSDPFLRLPSGVESWIAGLGWKVSDVEDLLFAKGSVGAGRIVASTVVFGFLFLLSTALWRPLQRALGWLLLPLGQNALFSYSAHVAIALALGLIARRGLSVPGAPWANALVQAGTLALIWLFIRFHVLMPSRATKRWWMAATVPLAVVVAALLPRVPEPSVAPVAAAPVSAQSAAEIARATRRYGTPVTRDRGIGPPSALGTPVPTDASAGAVAAGTPVPGAPALPPAVVARAAPGPDPLLVSSADGQQQASAYVGPIHGLLRDRDFYSPALDADLPYLVYLPPQYGTEQRRYPVLYMLHGGAGDRQEWAAYGLIDTVDRLIQSKEIRPMIVVLAEGQEGYWVNHVDGGPQWGDYISKDLVRQIDATYRTLPDADHRAIGGNSTGASGALRLAFDNPDVFHAVGAHSPALYPEDPSFDFIMGTGMDWNVRDPIWLAANAPGLSQLDIWIDIGEDDPWAGRADELHEALASRGIPHAWSLQPGGHEGDYWESHLAAYLRFYDSVLNRSDPNRTVAPAPDEIDAGQQTAAETTRSGGSDPGAADGVDESEGAPTDAEP